MAAPSPLLSVPLLSMSRYSLMVTLPSGESPPKALPVASRYLVPVMVAGGGVAVSEAVLLLGLVSVTPGGAETVTVLVRLPVAAAEIWATTVKVTVAPGMRLTEALTLPEPLLWPTLAPLLATAVQLALVK